MTELHPARYSSGPSLPDAHVLDALNLPVLIERLNDILDELDTRMGTVEKRIDVAGVKELPDGVPDDEVEKYFGMYTLWGN